MMATLLKHEWLRTRGTLGTVAGLVALLTVLGTVLAATGWPLLSQVGLVTGGVSVVLLVPVLQLVLTADYYRSSYARTGYFTHSLPIRGARIYAAKIAWVIAVTFAALLTTAVLAGIFWMGAASNLGMDANPLTALRSLWEDITSVASTGTLLALGVLFVGMYLIWPVQYFFAVSRGSERPLNRWGLGGPVLVFVVLYFVGQFAGVLGLFVLPFGLGMQDGSLGLVPYSMIEELRLGSGGAEETMPLGFIPGLFLVAVYCLWRTVRSWNHKVSLV